MSHTVEDDGGSIAYVYLLASVAALGGLLFGYDTAVIAGAIEFLVKRFELDATQRLGGGQRPGRLHDRSRLGGHARRPLGS